MKGVDQYLPARFRQDHDQASKQDASDEHLDAADAARYMLSQSEHHNQTILYALAVSQGRWRAAVWLVEHLLKRFGAESPRSTRSRHLMQQWSVEGDLDELTMDPISFVEKHDRYTSEPHLKASASPSLEHLTDDEPENLSQDEKLRVDILGMIWFTIGRMVSVFATEHPVSGGDLRPEVLEMIALLHHYELMPKSIYSYLPVESEDAIQQPPTLHLLSSRIMTALSDATWRAREHSALEAAQNAGPEYQHEGPEVPGSSYRVRVTAVKPEIWLELMLWSCLHGGWIKEGVMLLTRLTQRDGREKQWRPISWRESLHAAIPFGNSELLDWDSIKYIYDNRAAATMDHVDMTGVRLEKTVSSEVVDAYIDALVSIADLGVGSRGVSLTFIVRSLRSLREFLQRANLNLGGGSWNALVLRIADTVGTTGDQGAGWVSKISSLAPRFGQELHARRSTSLPPYINEGSAAILGLLHRALRDVIREGNFERALGVFRSLQERIDDDKNRSLHDFFENRRSDSGANRPRSNKELFTSNFAGIEHPALDTQIPANILAEFMGLVVDSKAFGFGHWMLFSEDVDGPIIPERFYHDPAIASALIRYAVATDNLSFLTKVINRCSQADGRATRAVPLGVLQSFLDAQIELRRWSNVEQILGHMENDENLTWSVTNLANMLRSLVKSTKATADDYQTGKPNVLQAEAFAARMLSEKLPSGYARTQDSMRSSHITSLTVVLSAVSERWAAFCRDQRSFPHSFYYDLPTTVFNRLFEAIVLSHGSTAGRLLVEKLSKGVASSEDHPDEELRIMDRVPRFRSDALQYGVPQRRVVWLPGSGIGKVAMYGSLRPDQATVNILYDQAVKELDVSPQIRGVERQGASRNLLDTFAWIAVTSRRLGINQQQMRDRLELSLSAEDFAYVGLKEDEQGGASIVEDSAER